MQFKLHPLYDQSPLRDWISIGPNADSASPIGVEFQDLLKVAASNLDRFTSYALEQIRAHVGTPYLSERPFPEINSVLFRPTSGDGFQIYVEYFFFQKSDENSPDSDVWTFRSHRRNREADWAVPSAIVGGKNLFQRESKDRRRCYRNNYSANQ